MKSEKAQTSIEFLTAFGIVVILFLVFSVIIYQKTLQANEIKIDVAEQRLANSIADTINSVYIAGEGTSTDMQLPAKIHLDSYEVKFYKNEPTVFVFTERQSWSAPIVTPYAGCTLNECNVLNGVTTIPSPDNGTLWVGIVRRNDTIYIGFSPKNCPGNKPYIVDGVCCDATCNSLCESCNQPGFEGTCLAYGAGTDPEGECGGELACASCKGGGESTCYYVPVGQQGNCPDCKRCDAASNCENAPQCNDCYGCTGSCNWCDGGECVSCDWRFSYTKAGSRPHPTFGSEGCTPSNPGQGFVDEGVNPGTCGDVAKMFQAYLSTNVDVYNCICN